MAGRFDFGYRPNLSVSSPLHAANAMVQNYSSEVNEPSPNVPKLAPINDVLNKCSNSSMLLRVKKLSKKAVLPSRVVALSGGYNLYSAMETKVPAQGKVLVPTDLSIAIPEGTYARIVSLSKLTLKHAISVGAGVIDADYRGPVGLILFNHSDVDFEVRVGDRIAQLILPKIPTPNVLEGKDLDSTVGIEGAFGSIGGSTAMVQNYNSEAHEPLSKVPKLAHMNDVLNKCSNSSMLLRVEKLSEKAVLPLRASALSAGYDLSSAMETKVPARGKVLVSTDLSIAIPEGTYARIAPRSGLALKHAIHVGEGVIDADYRGPVGVILFNHSDVDFEVKVGDRIAQLILETIATPNVLEGEDLDSTVRAMVQNYNSEANELLPKVPKLAHMNDVLNKCSNSSMLLRVEKLSEKAVLPLRASALSAGYDLSSAMETKVPARGRVMVPIDLSIAIPEGTYARIASQSGLALKHAIEVGAGMIDVDYIGPIGVILFNHSDVDFEVKVGDKIAQLILEKIATLNVLEVEDLDSTVRGEGGFGSTGL